MLADIRFNSIKDGDAIAARCGVVFRPPMDVCIARLTRRGDLRGGVLYTNWTGVGGSVCVHLAGWDGRWASRGLLVVGFDYPFNQLGVKKIFAQVAASNLDMLVIAERLGFKRELGDTLIRDVYPDGDMVLLSMYRRDCSFLRQAPLRIGWNG